MSSSVAVVVPDAVRGRGVGRVHVEQAVRLGEDLDRVLLPVDPAVAHDEVAAVLRQPGGQEVRLFEQQADAAARAASP